MNIWEVYLKKYAGNIFGIRCLREIVSFNLHHWGDDGGMTL